MPLNFTLGESAARVPMSGNPVTPVTGDQSFKTQNDQMDTGEKARSLSQAANDRTALDEYIKNGGDLYTAPGAQKGLQDLRGKVGSDVYMKLAAHADQMRKSEVAFNNDLMTADENKLKLYGQRIEYTMPMLDQLKQTYEKTKAEKGEVTARAEFDAAKAKLVSGVDQAHGGYHPELNNILQGANPENIDFLMANTKYHKDKVETAYKEAQTKKDLAMADAYGGKGTDFYKDPTSGAIYRANPTTGIAERQLEGGGWVPAALPAGATPLKNSGSAGKIAEQQKHTVELLTHPTVGLLDTAINVAVTGKMDVLGQNNPDRDAIVKIKNVLTNTPEGAAAAASYSADKKSLENVTKINDVISANDKTAENLINKLKPLMAKGATSPTDVKFLNEWINKIRTGFGDVDLAQVAIFDKALQADVARIQSGTAGAGTTPIQFLKNAQVVLPPGLPAEMYPKIFESIRSDLDARKAANASQSAEISARIQKSREAVAKLAAKAAEKANSHDLTEFGGSSEGASPSDTKVAPSVQQARDTDAGAILRSEYDKAKVAFSEAKTTEEKNRALNSMKGARKELVNLKVKDLPPLSDLDYKSPATTASKAVVWKDFK
ncbi:MAG: hypothetical protein NVSMB70_06300 [Chamaesiphon sp.]